MGFSWKNFLWKTLVITVAEITFPKEKTICENTMSFLRLCSVLFEYELIPHGFLKEF